VNAFSCRVGGTAALEQVWTMVGVLEEPEDTVNAFPVAVFPLVTSQMNMVYVPVIKAGLFARFTEVDMLPPEPKVVAVG
jgi:hypothetical protein